MEISGILVFLSFEQAPVAAHHAYCTRSIPGAGGTLLTKEILACFYFFAILEEMAKRGFSGEFELLVMFALIRIPDNAYGVPISREIERRAGRGVSLGSVYATLERLEKQGLVASDLGEPTPERGGRAKRYFHITDAGLATVRESRRVLISSWEGLPQLSEALL
jgi:DNA-binding PadR family transcriptional regulator